MCAIFGWYGSDSQDKLLLMADTMRHRGPDGDGYMHTPLAALGMTRLAILDVSNGQQPFHTNDGKISVVCNGEIYNFKELKRELESLGYQFQTQCDVEIIPAAYQQWGGNFLQRLNGMFAIAIFDHTRGELILARDRSGQKPLYYSQHEGSFYFSSEIRGLHKVGVTKALNHSAIPAYLSLRYVPEPDTLFRAIQILPAGHTLIINAEGQSLKKWFRIEPRVQKMEEGDAVDQLYELTQSSIRTALISEVPIAVHLSAGVDSSVLLSEIHQLGTPVTAITAGFGARSDEVVEAAALCEHYSIPHTKVILGPDDFASLPRVISQMELPVGDALILAFDRLAGATHNAGCRVAIGGEGVDELFCGYSFHKIMLLAERLGVLGRQMAAIGIKLTPAFLLNKISAFPADIGGSGKGKINRYLSGYHHLSKAEKGVELRSLFSKVELEVLHEPYEQAAITGDGDLLESQLMYQFQSWLQDWAIIRQERNCMAHSVEYRMPFLDHRLIEFAFNLPNQLKLNGTRGKFIWRQMAAKYYPEAHCQRSKQPFYFPTESEAYFGQITKLLDSAIGSESFQRRQLFDMEMIGRLRRDAERTREFLPIKQLLSLAILELWMQEHGL
ncbi:MAG: asparagine synthase (glutamine-hydrolyzing) [Akkermansiaceae bacterium]